MSSNEPTSPVGRVFLDCTDTYTSDWHTGVQRVVRNVAGHSGDVGRELGVTCQPMVRVRDRYVTVAGPPPAQRPPRWWLRGLQPTGTHRWIGDPRRGRQVLRWMGVRLSKLLHPGRLIRGARLRHWARSGEVAVPGPGDTLVLLDAWWNQNVWPPVARARRNGAVVGVVMYDLLPITHPQYFRTKVRESFTASLTVALEQADFFVAISDVVRDTLRAYAAEHGPPRWRNAARFLSFQLGSTLDSPTRARPPRAALRKVFASHSTSVPYLTVGTIEPRKNHVLLMDAFERVWERFPDVSVCLVGRVGWLCDELLGRMRRHPQYNRRLHLFHDLSDSELEYCYQHAKALLFPSRAEGFGLPMVEALRQGLPVMASDIPVHREVGRDYCTYFHPRRPEELADLILRVETSGQFPAVRVPDGDELPTWRDSTRDFITKCLVASQSSCRSQRAA